MLLEYIMYMLKDLNYNYWVYLIKVGEKSYKYGRTIHLYSRLNCHVNDREFDFTKIVRVWGCNSLLSMRNVENQIRKKVKIENIRDRNFKCSEVFSIGENEINGMIDFINDLVISENEKHEDEELENPYTKKNLGFNNKEEFDFEKRFGRVNHVFD